MHSLEGNTAIYKRLAKRLEAGLINGDPAEGNAMPTVRELATLHVVHPLHVEKALGQLQNAGLLVRHEGSDVLYVRKGARATHEVAARERFLLEEWPALQARLKSLGITPTELPWGD